jgi:hypothetical protein
MLHVRFQLTFAIQPPQLMSYGSYTMTRLRVTTLRQDETLDKNSLGGYT